MTTMTNRALCLACVLLGLGIARAQCPYPVQPLRATPVAFAVERDNERIAAAILRWSAQHFVVDISVTDDTPAFIDSLGLPVNEGYRADSVEFWANRHQFGLIPRGDSLVVYDYLYDQEASEATGTVTRTATGYRLRAMVPWATLRLPPVPRTCFQFALQVNDSPGAVAGRWKDRVRQTLFPAGAVWDRPDTYGTVFINRDLAPASCVSSPQPFAAITLTARAYTASTECRILRLGPYIDRELTLRLVDDRGQVFNELPVPAGHGVQYLDLPWDSERRGIFSAELYVNIEEGRFGPLAVPYVNGGSEALAAYRSPRQPPADLAAFWTRRLAAMRAEPFAAEDLPVDNPWPQTEVRKVRIRNHRGNPMIVYLTWPAAAEGKLPAFLNVYPPMRASEPKRGPGDVVTVTFCGSLQGEARLPEQEADENLWARSDSLPDCYWLDVVLDGVRALDYAASLPLSNGQAKVTGGSRGGWYTFALAAVAPDRVTYARATSPCYADVTMNMKLGHGSAAHEIYSRFTRDRRLTEGRVFRTFEYFDPLFLAGMVRTRLAFSAGLQDHICSAVGMVAAAHNATHPDVYFILDPEAGHGGSPHLSQFDAVLGMTLR